MFNYFANAVADMFAIVFINHLRFFIALKVNKTYFKIISVGNIFSGPNWYYFDFIFVFAFKFFRKNFDGQQEKRHSECDQRREEDSAERRQSDALQKHRYGHSWRF